MDTAGGGGGEGGVGRVAAVAGGLAGELAGVIRLREGFPGRASAFPGGTVAEHGLLFWPGRQRRPGFAPS